MLLNKVLELTIEDINYISFPCKCPDKDPSLQHDQHRAVTTLFNVVIAKISYKAMKRINVSFSYRCQLKHSSLPGCNPISAALGMSKDNFGICNSVLKKFVVCLLYLFSLAFIFYCSYCKITMLCTLL
jgi:hypothetical protein